jgi:23S rRNA (pseudouridine1915-N3)-methyltransferase
VKFQVVAVGHRMPGWVKEGVEDYVRRMPRDFPCSITEIKPEARTGKDVSRVLAAESARIETALPGACIRVILDERGDLLTTARLADKFKVWMQDGRDVGFVIGSADGLDPQLKKSADLLLALSAFTLPHGLARVVLVEQLYRAFTLLNNHPYHRE